MLSRSLVDLSLFDFHGGRSRLPKSPHPASKPHWHQSEPHQHFHSCPITGETRTSLPHRHSCTRVHHTSHTFQRTEFINFPSDQKNAKLVIIWKPFLLSITVKLINWEFSVQPCTASTPQVSRFQASSYLIRASKRVCEVHARDMTKFCTI